ncbi:hypothetical protein M0812_15327 [Anaeramoeba flamelloides]|uniref:Uncharacterized protein n=1 Tax=Anaeramoeba flamelloides TaxID=1746091 RepID=A0AAV7ZB90_9EUKA|nr:hypothetical protein M0812_15327 [Anaeramoeba flamelloides]
MDNSNPITENTNTNTNQKDTKLKQIPEKEKIKNKNQEKNQYPLPKEKSFFSQLHKKYSPKTKRKIFVRGKKKNNITDNFSTNNLQYKEILDYSFSIGGFVEKKQQRKKKKRQKKIKKKNNPKKKNKDFGVGELNVHSDQKEGSKKNFNEKEIEKKNKKMKIIKKKSGIQMKLFNKTREKINIKKKIMPYKRINKNRALTVGCNIPKINENDLSQSKKITLNRKTNNSEGELNIMKEPLNPSLITEKSQKTLLKTLKQILKKNNISFKSKSKFVLDCGIEGKGEKETIKIQIEINRV